jgi:nucleotide-binding universal stress UspA family protein
LQTILTGYDGSKAAERALARAIELAQAFSATLIVASVRPPPTPTLVESGDIYLGAAGVPPLPTTETPPAAARAAADTARASLERARTLVPERGLEAEYVALEGDPAVSLIECADERNADLIVVGGSEPGFLQRLLGHSVSDSLARRAHRDVLVVRSTEV